VAEIARQEFDILHLHVPNPAAAAAYLVARGLGKSRLVITHHSDIVRQTRMRRLVRPLMRIAMGRAAAIIATSPDYLASSEELRPYIGKCRIIPYGVDLMRLEPGANELARAADLRKQLPGPIVLAVGRLIYYKGFDVAIRAMAKVDATLLLVGEGPLRKSLEDLSDSLGVAAKIRFAGEVHNRDLLPYYLASDVFVFPSVARSEAFGIVQLEAMACRLPIVNTQLDSGVPYASRHLETGLTVPPGDVVALGSALRRLLESPTERKRFGVAGRLRVEREFSSLTMTSRHLDLYTELLGQRADKPQCT
jgi:glycosyltransferase involved in cell wall biosynthesis